MNHYDKAWQNLVSAARRVQDVRDTAAPYGFATRVAALAVNGRQSTGIGSLFERFSWRALLAAALLAIGGVATNYASAPAASNDELPLDETVVTVVFDIS